MQNPVELYTNQIQGFINTYNLPYSADELMDEVGEKCAVSNIDDVVQCLKCHFITPLNYSDEDNYNLSNNFELVVDCIDSSEPDCVQCNLAIQQQFEIDLNISLSSSQRENIRLNSNYCDDNSLYNEASIIGVFDNSSIAIDVYVDCSDVIFQENPNNSGEMFAQIYHPLYVVALLCIPPPEEGLLPSFTPYIEITIPKYLFTSSVFDYANHQTNVAQIITLAISDAKADLEFPGSCDDIALQQANFLESIFSFLNDDVNKSSFWGETGDVIDFGSGFTIEMESYSPVKSMLTFYNSSNCN